MAKARERGTIHVIGQTESYGQKGFMKRSVVIEQEQGRYTNLIPFEVTGDRCLEADELCIGDEIDVEYRLSGRKWQKDPSSEIKYFLSAEMVSWTVISSSGKKQTNQEDVYASDNEDMPF